MKEKIVINNKEQIELITDPFCLSILNVMEESAVSREYIVDQLEEGYKLVNDYIERMVVVGIVDKIKDNGEVKYRKAARTFELEKLSNNFDGNVYNHWIFGLIHHIESNLTDLLKILKNADDSEQFLNNLGYCKTRFTSTLVYLDREGIDELDDMMKKFIEKHGDKPEEIGDKRTYELNLIMHPEISSIKKKVK